jgi:hypothetical protein
MDRRSLPAHLSCNGPVVALLVLLAVTASPAAYAESITAAFECDIPNLVISADDRRDTKSACEGARAAIDFLAAAGLDVSGEIRIEIVAALGGYPRHSAAGCFLASSHKVMVLRYAEFLDIGEWCGIPIDRDLYRGLIAHETAHVIAACNFKDPKPTIQAQEYIAYVTMLSTMDPAHRDRVLTRFPGDGYETEQQMNTTIYLCDPMRFGVQAYRHFLKEGNGTDFIRAILAGKALAE